MSISETSLVDISERPHDGECRLGWYITEWNDANIWSI